MPQQIVDTAPKVAPPLTLGRTIMNAIAVALSVVTLFGAPFLTYLATFGSGTPYLNSWAEIREYLPYIILFLVGPTLGVIMCLRDILRKVSNATTWVVLTLSLISFTAFILTAGGIFAEGIYKGYQQNISDKERIEGAKEQRVQVEKTVDILAVGDIFEALAFDPASFDFTRSYRNPSGSVSAAEYENKLSMWRGFVDTHSVSLNVDDSLVVTTEIAPNNKKVEVYLDSTNSQSGQVVPISVTLTVAAGKIYLDDINTDKRRP